MPLPHQHFKLVTRPKRSFTFTIFSFIPLLLVGIMTALFITITVLGIINNPASIAIIYALAASIFAIIGTLSITKVFLWTNFGKEIIFIDDNHLFIRRKFVFGIKNEKLDLSKIRNIRLVKSPEYELDLLIKTPWQTRAVYGPTLGGSVAFDLEDKSIYLGNLLPDDKAKKLLLEIEKRAKYSGKVIDLNKTNFPRIQVSTHKSNIHIKYSPKRDYLVVIALFSWWTIWVSAASQTLIRHYENNTTITHFSLKEDYPYFILLSTSLIVLFWTLHLVLNHERIELNKNHITIRKPYSFSLKKTIPYISIQSIYITENLHYKRYWSMGKYIKNITYIIKLGNRLKINTASQHFEFGKGLSYPEGLYIKTIIEDRKRASTLTL